MARRRLSQIFVPREQEFFDLFEEAGGNILRAAELLERMLGTYPEHGDLARDILICEQDGDRITHDIIQAAQPDLRHADRPRGHLRARLGARRHRRLHRGGRRLPRPLQDRGADGAGPGDGARAARRRAPARRRRCRGCATSATSTTSRSRSTGSRTRATGSMREALAALFQEGIDPMVVIRWKDIYDRLEDGDRLDREGREHAREHRDQELLEALRRVGVTGG